MNSSHIYKEYIPAYLYIKQHRITKKLYFGMTRNKRGPEFYKGSGIGWIDHLKEHGKEHVETLWYCLFLDEASIKEFALMFSRMHNIVESDEWLNRKEEDGSDGGGVKYSAESRRKMSVGHIGKETWNKGKTFVRIPNPCEYGREPWNKGIPMGEETKAKLSAVRTGVPSPKLGTFCTQEHKDKVSAAKTGKPWSPARRESHEKKKREKHEINN